MEKIYFYKTTNSELGDLYQALEDGKIIESDERGAFALHKKYQFLGWSDGMELLRHRKKVSDSDLDKKTKMLKRTKKSDKALLQEAIRKEIEKAINNPDKSPPPDPSVMGIDGRPIRDPSIRSRINLLR